METADDNHWYSAKCLFRHRRTDEGVQRVLYEERFVLLRAADFDAAVIKAEADAEAYAREIDGCAYIGFTDLFQLFDREVGEGTELYSLLRESDLSPGDYLDRYYDTGMERSREFERPNDADEPE